MEEVFISVGPKAERTGKPYCGEAALPKDSAIVGTVGRSGVGSGALVFLQPNMYVCVNQGVVHPLEQRAVHEALKEAYGAAGKET